jgi:hypothetical protein
VPYCNITITINGETGFASTPNCNLFDLGYVHKPNQSPTTLWAIYRSLHHGANVDCIDSKITTVVSSVIL